MSPDLNRRLRDAVAVALTGDWQAAHLVAQDHEDEPIANWLHAVVHRMEGDLANAGYWYRRCGRPLRAGIATDVELREIANALAGPEPKEGHR
jgi:hypothetical protein